MRLGYIVLLFSCLLSLSTLIAQEKKIKYLVGLNRGGGYIIEHTPSLAYLAQTHISKWELYGEVKSLGEQSWHQRYHYPSYGISLNYFDLNNEEHLGKAYALLPYFKFNVWTPSELFLLRFRGGIGLGIIEKGFHPTENYKNIAIGSQLNVFFSFCLTSEYTISDRTSIILGANLSHFSNTAFQKPNLGINIPTLDLGLQQRFGRLKEKKVWDEESFKRKEGQWQMYLAAGINELDAISGRKYMATAFSIRREKKLNYKSIIGAGIDFYHNPTYRLALEQDSIFINRGMENIQMGTSFHHILRFGRISNIVQLGVYLNNRNNKIGNFYQIVGGKYHFNRRWKGMIALKTHLSVAEYLMFGFEYSINGRDE